MVQRADASARLRNETLIAVRELFTAEPDKVEPLATALKLHKQAKTECSPLDRAIIMDAISRHTAAADGRAGAHGWPEQDHKDYPDEIVKLVSRSQALHK